MRDTFPLAFACLKNAPSSLPLHHYSIFDLSEAETLLRVAIYLAQHWQVPD